MLEKEHYGEIMESFINLSKNFMLFLGKDEEYGEIISGASQSKGVEEVNTAPNS